MVPGNDKFYALHRDVLMNVWIITGSKTSSNFDSKCDKSITKMYFMNTGDVSETDISEYQKGLMEGR